VDGVNPNTVKITETSDEEAEMPVPPKITSSLDDGEGDFKFSWIISYARQTIEPDPLRRAVTVMLSRPDWIVW
jgi:hypothetical protein